MMRESLRKRCKGETENGREPGCRNRKCRRNDTDTINTTTNCYCNNNNNNTNVDRYLMPKQTARRQGNQEVERQAQGVGGLSKKNMNAS